MLFTTLAVALLASSVLAAPSPKYVQHERRHLLPRGWRKVNAMHSKTVLPMRIALTQPNLQQGYDYLIDVSHPQSPNYGKHWSAKQVAETFAPTQESVDAVMEWLEGSGISSTRISRSQSLGWLQFNASVAEAESLLKTRYHLHRHQTGKPHVGCSSYHIPEHLKSHIDFITPTVHFDAKVPMAEAKEEKEEGLGKRTPDLDKRTPASITTATLSQTAAAGVPIRTKAALQITDPYNGFNPKKGADIDIEELLDELEECNTHITPNCLRALYRFPPGFTANPKNSYGIVE